MPTGRYRQDNIHIEFDGWSIGGEEGRIVGRGRSTPAARPQDPPSMSDRTRAPFSLQP